MTIAWNHLRSHRGLISGLTNLSKSPVENLGPVPFIGIGWNQKTSVALTVLHHDQIKERFYDDRRFIRCDQFTASQPNFLNRLSKAAGAGLENPDDLGQGTDVDQTFTAGGRSSGRRRGNGDNGGDLYTPEGVKWVSGRARLKTRLFYIPLNRRYTGKCEMFQRQ